MSLGLPNFKCLGGLIVCVAGMAVSGGEAASLLVPGSPMEFSEPKKGGVVTNLNLSDTKYFSVEDVESGAFRPNTLMPAKSSFNGPMAPLRPGSIIQSRRTREQADQRNNWAFVTPDDMMQQFITRQILRIPGYGAEGKEKYSGSSVERYFERMSRHNAGRETLNYDLLGRQKTDREGNEGAAWSDSVMLDGLGRPESSLKTLLNPELGSRKSGLQDLFKRNEDDFMSPEAVRARQARTAHLDEYKKILGFESLPAASALDSPVKLPVAKPAAGSPYSATSQRNPLGPVFGAVNPPGARIPTAPAAPNAPLAPGQQSSLSPTPAYTYTPPPAPPKATFAVPKRGF